MTGPEQHAATVRTYEDAKKALAAGHLSYDRWVPVALAERAAKLERENERLRRDPKTHPFSTGMDLLRRAEAAEARADELQRERDGYAETIKWFWFKFAPGQTYADVDGKTIHELVEAKLAEVEQARREADQLRARARRVEYAWENLRGWMPNGRGVPNWTREMDGAVAALAGPTSSDGQAEPGPGVQAEEQTT